MHLMELEEKNPYLFSIFTRNNKGTSWGNDNEAWALSRNISALLWNHFKGKTTL